MTSGPILFGTFALGMVVAGLAVTGPSLGYPPPTRATAPATVFGVIHTFAGLVLFVSLAGACFMMARRFRGDPAWRGWAAGSIVIGVIVLAFFAASDLVSKLDENGVLPNAPTGLLQRLSIIPGFGWIAAFAVRLFRIQRARPA